MLSEIADLPAIKLNDTEWLRFDLQSMSPFAQEIAEKELRETSEVKEKAKGDLKALLQGNECYATFSLHFTSAETS